MTRSLSTGGGDATQHSERPQGDMPAPRLASEAAEPGSGWQLPPRAAGLGSGLGARPLGGAGPTARWPWVTYSSSLSPYLLLANGHLVGRQWVTVPVQVRQGVSGAGAQEAL